MTTVKYRLLACSRRSDRGDGAKIEMRAEKKRARGRGRGESESFLLSPSPPSLPTYFFPPSYFAPHSTIRTPLTG